MTITSSAPAPASNGTTAALLRQLESELNLCFFERREAINAVLICLLARQNGFILGPPGVAKSQLLEVCCQAFTGAKYFRILLDPQMGKEELWGQVDQARFLNENIWERDTTDTFADCHVALLDEVGRAGSGLLNSLLTGMNERLAKPGKVQVQMPLVSAFGASNSPLEGEAMEAMWDRFPVRLVTGDIVEDGNFIALLEMAAGQRALAQVTTRIPLEDLLYACDVEVPSISLPAHVMDSMRQLRSDLRAEQITASPRRWAQSVSLLKASAYLNGRTVVDDDDLAVLRWVLWDVVEQIPMVERKVIGFTSTVARAAMELADRVAEVATEVDKRHGKALDERALYGADAMHTLSVLEGDLTAAYDAAVAEGRSTARLDAVREQITQTTIAVYVVCMNTPIERAKRMAGL